MAPLKTKGDLAELKVACDLVERGYRVAIPFGEDCDFDLVAWQDPTNLERFQVKYTTSDGEVIPVRCRSSSLTNGKVRRIKRYTDQMVDWIAVYDATSKRCYYVPASELGNGRDMISLRLAPTKNCQRLGIRYAEEYLDPVIRTPVFEMEPAGLEPAPSELQIRRSPN
jgi:hypothetical protein